MENKEQPSHAQRDDDQTDLTFFTNEKDRGLLDRFISVLNDTRHFDVLVGYFRSSGFHQLAEALAPVGKIRILVGLNMDQNAYQDIQEHYKQVGELDLESHKKAKERFQKTLQVEIETSKEEDDKLETGVRQFLGFLNKEVENPALDKEKGGNGKQLEIRAYPSENIHAKVYIGKFKDGDRDYGYVITGSSNFSERGLVANREFNVELRAKRDVLFAEDQFNGLWEDGVEVSEGFVDTITTKTWLNDQITPYELYLKLIYEYLEEDINLADQSDLFLPKGFMKLKYQSQAAIQAKKILKKYNGVFLADVVGLGKTFITGLLLQQLHGRALVICPPALTQYWRDALSYFEIRSFVVESLGKLGHVIRKGLHKYDHVVIDEAHRFRNDGTQAYADLLGICKNKKVILVTATPLNNKIDDILALLKLFQAPKRPTLPGVQDLDAFFKPLKKKLDKTDKASPGYKAVIKEVSDQIRNGILKYVMVRRTRHDVVNYFREDVEKQGLAFPKVSAPEKIVYKYKGDLEQAFNETIKLLQEFTYTRYTPLLYYTGNITSFEEQQQRNVGGFMKVILVKRMESSFFAFKQSIGRFIVSYENFIRMFNKGTVYISKKANVYDLLDNEDLDKLEGLINEGDAHKYDSKDFKKDFIPKLERDLGILKDIQAQWENVTSDPKLDQFVLELKKNKTLTNSKMVIFTEAKETGGYIYEKLIGEFPGQVMFCSSEGVRHTKSHENTLLRNYEATDLVNNNFDPNTQKEKQVDDLRILITTDILAEGVNLHRANIIINYDLPWNPTRVLQRVGRVNRLGSKFDEIHIFNFFPASHSDAHLGLEVNVTNKIQMFHDILGEDARYLTDTEQFDSQELFNKLNDEKTYSGEDEEGDSELKYLEIIRKIRDKAPGLFEKIKELPKKARSGFVRKGLAADCLVTFFRAGNLKKFYANENGQSREITFFEAVAALECGENTKRAGSPDAFFDLLRQNKAKFESDAYVASIPATTGGKSNTSYIEDRLSTIEFKYCKAFKDDDKAFNSRVMAMLKQGTMASKTAQNIKKKAEKEISPEGFLAILREYVPAHDLPTGQDDDKRESQKKEVILSGYILK